MAKQIHYIERVKFTITFYVTGTDQVRLVNIVSIKCFSEIWILNAFGNVGSFSLISPSPFKTRLMVLSEGKSYPELLNSHFMAEAPVWAKPSDSRRVLTEIMRCLSISLSCVGLFNGALDLSLYDSDTPVW